MSVEHLDLLHAQLPELFQDRNLASGWHEDLIIVPVSEPERITTEGLLEESDAPGWASHTHDQSEDAEEDILDAVGPSLIEPGIPVPGMDPTIIQVLGGGHAGAPVPSTHPQQAPPPDSLAFYLPFHYYHPGWWGVYLIYEGVLWLAGDIMKRSNFNLSNRRAFESARLFLYYHEAFHHKVECFATRLELTHRRPFYKTGFERYYQKTLGTDECLEEGLANASALKDSLGRSKDAQANDALIEYVLSCPPGYNRGNEFRKELPEIRSALAEDNQRVCLPHLPQKDPGVWLSAPHLFDGISNIKARVNYVIPRNSSVANRLPFRPCLTPNKVVAKLRQLVGLDLVREGSRHQVWKTSSGRILEIPRHPRDLSRGLLRQILRQAGLDMGLEEFLSA